MCIVNMCIVNTENKRVLKKNYIYGKKLHAWIDDFLIFIEAHSGAFSSPLGPLDIQIAFLYGQSGDALVVCSVELGQVLS